MKPQRDLGDIGHSAIEIAVKWGAELADAYVMSASQLELEVRNGQVESLAQSATLGLGLRVGRGGRAMLVHTTDTSGLAISRLVEQAMEVVDALPVPKVPAGFAPAQLIDGLPHADPNLLSEPWVAKTARLVDIEKAMLAVAGVSAPVASSYEEIDGEIALVSSRGLRLYTPFSWLHIYTECVAERDEETATGSDYIAVPSRARIPDPEAIGRRAGERAVALLGARKIPTVKAPVIFTPQTGWALLQRLVPALNGNFVVQGRSFLSGSLGQRIAADGVTIRDDAHLRGGAASRPFDGEGSPTTDLALVEDGVLRAFLTDIASAEQLGMPCGGNTARDSYAEQPQISTSNFYLQAGGRTPEEIIRDTPRGLLLGSLSGWWVGSSPSSEVFSSAAMGHWIENGEIAYPVRGISIGGNLREMLTGIDRVGSDLEFIGETRTPTFRVAEMAISGS